MIVNSDDRAGSWRINRGTRKNVVRFAQLFANGVSFALYRLQPLQCLLAIGALRPQDFLFSLHQLGFRFRNLGLKPPDLPFRLAAAGAVTALGFSLFAEDIIGAGDAKLAGAIVLWVDPLHLPLFVLATGTIGAMLGIAAAARHRFAGVDEAALADRRRASLPYGVALAGAGLIIHPLSSLLHP